MAQIIWSVKAKQDLQDIFDFIGNDSQLYALTTVDSIVWRTKLLEEHYKSGRIVPEFNRTDIREVFEGNYRIIYYLKDDFILITRVYHRSRLLKTL